MIIIIALELKKPNLWCSSVLIDKDLNQNITSICDIYKLIKECLSIKIISINEITYKSQPFIKYLSIPNPI